jgi:hypothetical protein
LSNTTNPHVPVYQYWLEIERIQSIISVMLPFRCNVSTIRLVTGIFDPTLTT